MKRGKLSSLMFILYIIILLRITVLRSDFLTHGWFNGSINLVPFADLVGILKHGEALTFIYLFAGNILWFIPLGIFLKFKYKLSLIKGIFLGFILSFIIELLQFVFSTGVSEVDDLLLNTFGTLLGWFIGGLNLYGCKKLS